MADSQKNPEWVIKIIGTLSGLILWFIWGFLIVSIGSFSLHSPLNTNYPLGFWIYLGPLPLIVGAGFYYFNQKYWPVLKQQRQLAMLKAGILGFFLWTAVIVILPDIGNISSIFPNLAGWLLMIVIMVYFRKILE